MQSESNTNSIRRALRSYHCHACDRDFRQMVDMNDLTSTRCPNCESDFVEEKRSFEEAKVQAQPQPQPQPQQRPQPMPQPQAAQQQMPQMHQQQQQFSFGSQPGMQLPGMRQQQTVTRTYSPSSGWTQSVTISYGTGSQGPTIHQSHQSQGGFPTTQRIHIQQHQQPRPQPNEFASAAHAQQAQQPQAHQQMGGFHAGAQDPYAAMQDFFDGPMGAMGGMFRRPSPPRQQQQQQQQMPPQVDPRLGGLFDAFFAGGVQPMGAAMGGMGNVFFAQGFPMGGERPGSRGCSDEFIRNLPEKDKDKESDCYICLEKCKDGPSSCQLPCTHAFDRTCLENWLKDHDSCPVCRTKLDQENVQQRAQEQEQQNQQQPRMFFF